jgi:LysM repeat protein
MHDLALGGRARCLLVGLLATAVATGTVAWAAPDVAAAIAALRTGSLGDQSFDRLVVWLAATALTGCAAWGWVVTGVVVTQALAGHPRASAPGVPPWLRSGILLACGLAVVATGPSAHAGDPQGDGARVEQRQLLAGLPPPERVLGGVRAAPPPAEPIAVHVVRAGDTLWDIAATHLGGGADGDRIAAHWHRIYRLNRAVIGTDPDLIHPGQQLRLPVPPAE